LQFRNVFLQQREDFGGRCQIAASAKFLKTLGMFARRLSVENADRAFQSMAMGRNSPLPRKGLEAHTRTQLRSGDELLGELACNHPAFGARLFGYGPAEETQVALFAAEGAPENHGEKDRLTDSFRL
jgi:hypothetical protein